MITKKDRRIIKHIDKYGFATIEQIGKIFYNHTNYQYDMARRELKKIFTQGEYLRKFTNKETNQLIYTPKESHLKKLSKHSIGVMDYYSSLIEFGADILIYDIERTIGRVRPDAFISFALGSYIYYQLLEYQVRHDYVDINKYYTYKRDILELTKYQGKTVYPKIVIVQDTNKDYNKCNNTGLGIVQLRTDLKDISKIIL